MRRHYLPSRSNYKPRPRRSAAATCAGERMGARRGEGGWAWENPQIRNSDAELQGLHIRQITGNSDRRDKRREALGKLTSASCTTST